MFNNKYKIVLIIMIAVLLIIPMLFSCSKSSENSSDNSRVSKPMNQSMSSTQQESIGGYVPAEKSDEKSVSDNKNSSDKKIITTGYMEGKVQSIEQTLKILQDLCEKNKGYISSENTYKDSGRTTSNVTVRIPSEQYDDFMTSVEDLYISIDNKSLSRTDVTEEYFDIATRLNTKKAFHQRLLQLLKQANTVKDILEVENQLRMIQEEIEASEGRLKYLDNQVGYSTLNAVFYMTSSTIKGVTFWDKLLKSLKQSIDMLVALFLLIIKLWVFIVIGLGVYFYIIRKKLKK